MRIPYIKKCILINDECLCDNEQKKLCSNHQLVLDSEKIRENLKIKLKQINKERKMYEKVDEFLANEKLKANQKIKIITKDGIILYVTLEAFLDKYNIFLRKNSLIKG